MNSPRISAVLFVALVSAVALRANATCACCTAPAPSTATKSAAADTTAPTVTPATPAAAPVGHPLRGVVVDILADKQALLVKHEEIPGVMRAMTMLLKVDAPVLSTVTKGQTITATLLDKDDGWWLADVKPVESGEVAK
jgi:hypothetical protein